MVIASVAATAVGLVIDFTVLPLSDMGDVGNAECSVIAKCIAAIGFSILIVTTYVLAIIGLFFFWWWARPLFLASTCVMLVVYSFLGVYEVAAPADALYDAATLLEGAIIAAAYWSSISDRFVRTEPPSVHSRLGSRVCASIDWIQNLTRSNTLSCKTSSTAWRIWA